MITYFLHHVLFRNMYDFIITVFDLISEHTLISEHPPHFVLVKTIARAHRDLCVLAVLLCCIMQSIFDAN